MPSPEHGEGFFIRAGVLPDAVVEFLTTGLVGYALATLASVYATIVSMKLIGLYYRHYSDRFPWDAG